METRRYLVILIVLILALTFVKANIVLMWNSTQGSIPSGWSCISCQNFCEEENLCDFYQRYPEMSTAYGAKGGSNTHTHSFTISSSTGSTYGLGTAGLANSFNIAGLNHVHNSINVTATTSSTSQPLTKTLLFITYNDGIPTTIPPGAIAFFNGTTAPSNFTMHTAQDGYFVMGNKTANGITGQATNNHTNQSIKAGNPDSAGVGQTGIKTPMATNTHTHNLGSVGLGESDHTPLFVDMPLIYALSDTPIPIGMIAMFNSTPSSTWNVFNYNLGRYIKGNSTSFNTTGGQATHNHGWQQITTGTASASVNIQNGAVNQSYVGHTHNINISTSNANNVPAYTNTTFALYLGSANETEGRNAIVEGINNTIQNSTVYTDLEVDVRYLNGTQSRGIFDKIAFLNNQRWGFNYVTGSENFTNILSSSYKIFNVWENTSLSYGQIISQVSTYINQTKI